VPGFVEVPPDPLSFCRPPDVFFLHALPQVTGSRVEGARAGNRTSAGSGTGICFDAGSSICASIASCTGTFTSSGTGSGSFLDTGFDEVCFSTSFSY
jgi:hypothetical protein